MITIELPWPDKRLSPNSRCHWREKAEASYSANWIGTSMALDERKVGVGNYRKVVRNNELFEAIYIFHPPDNRRRDIDNCLAMMKPYQDGVCAGIEIDDYRIKRTVLEWGEVVKGGKVVLRLEEMTE